MLPLGVRGRDASLVAVTVAAIAAIGGCFSPEPAVGLGCADGDVRCPEGQVCDDAAGVCVPDSSLDTWRDDTATDFDDPTATLEDGTIEANGAVGPAPYFVDGLAIYGIASLAIGSGNEGTVTWDAIVAQPTAGRGFSHALDIASTSSQPPGGTGLSTGAGITVRLEGELYLPAGTTQFNLDTDDRGFFDLGNPATGQYTRVVFAAQPDGTGSATVPAAGWYPFRGAYENSSGGMRYELSTRPPGGSYSVVGRDRLRVRTDGLSGLALDGFDDSYLFYPTGTTLALDPLDNQAFAGAEHPPDVGDVGSGAWTTRWGGQVLVTTAGSYAFTLDTEGGHRMWIDGQQVASSSGAAAPEVTNTPPITLDLGWHDLVLDLFKDASSTDPTHLRLTIASGPEFQGTFFPVDQTRPVIGRGARWTTSSSGSTAAIADGGSATKTVSLVVPGGVSQALVADYEYGVTHQALATLAITLSRPGAGTSTLVAVGDLTGMGGHGGRRHYTSIDAVGSWTLTATDSDGTDLLVGSISSAAISATYRGGPQPFPTRTVYTSRVRELGPVVSISGVRWQTRQDPGGAVRVRVRSCDTADACASEAWTEVARSGDAAGVPARPFLQYQAEITGDGDIPTALDWIELDYRL